MKDTVQLKSLAKINLGLDVIGRRENGYHDVRMVMQTIYLYDDVTIKKTEEPGIVVKTNLSYLPVNEDNIAYKAAKILIDEFGIEQGVEITLNKHIPVAAGLAGGSSNAAICSGVNLNFSSFLYCAVASASRLSCNAIKPASGNVLTTMAVCAWR